MSNYIQKTDDILCLPVGYMAMLVTKRGDVYQGTVTDVDILEETVTVENGVVLTYEIAGYVERALKQQVLSNDEVIACISTFPLWNIIT